MPYAQDEYCEHVRLHVTNYAVVAYPVAPQATVVSAYLFDRRVVGLNNVGSVMRRRGVDERKRDCPTLPRAFVMLMCVSQMGPSTVLQGSAEYVNISIGKTFTKVDR